MADLELNSLAVGRVYAQVLLNLAAQRNISAEITADVRALGEVLTKNPALVAFVGAATISEEDKAKAIEKIFTGRFNSLLVDVLKSMAAHNRLMFMSGLVKGYEELLAVREGRVEVEITSAAPLDNAVFERVRTAVGNSLGGKTIQLDAKVNPALVGGMIVRIEDTQIDGSVETQLQKVKARLKREGALNLQSKFDQIVSG